MRNRTDRCETDCCGTDRCGTDRRKIVARIILGLSVCGGAVISRAADELPPASNDQQVIAHRVFKVSPLSELPADQLNHPLLPALRIAYQMADRIGTTVRDYTCRMVMRERVKGRLNPHEYALVKVRREQHSESGVVTPLSIYLRFQAPSAIKGREVLYVAGRNDGDLLARNGGSGNLQDVTLSLKPNSDRAMRGRHYPLTEIGMQNIVLRLIEIGMESMQADRQLRECEVRFIDNAKIEGRSCQCIQVTFPVRRENLRFHLARIFIDEELGLPVRFAAFSWSTEPDKAPLLMEEYTFLDLKVNVGLTDEDFDRNNPSYKFYRPQSSVDRHDRQAELSNP